MSKFAAMAGETVELRRRISREHFTIRDFLKHHASVPDEFDIEIRFAEGQGLWCLWIGVYDGELLMENRWSIDGSASEVMTMGNLRNEAAKGAEDWPLVALGRTGRRAVVGTIVGDGLITMVLDPEVL